MLVVALLIMLTMILLIFLNYKNKSVAECKKDRDCIKTQITCCPCSMGGEERCLPESEYKFYKEKLENECEENTICPAVYSCEIEFCECLNGICTEK